MSFRNLAVVAVVSWSSVAVADELSIAAVCAEIDETRDTQSPADRAVARDHLARALQDADVLVVETGCTERYLLSHEAADTGEPLVRIKGPVGARRIRNPDRDALPAIYSRMVHALLEAQEEAHNAAVIEPHTTATVEARETGEPDEIGATEATSARPRFVASTEPEEFDEVAADVAPTVRTDSVWYLQALAGNYGKGLGLGVRVPVSDAGALDVGFTFAGGSVGREMAAFGGKYLHHVSPHETSSAYVGGGLSMASQTADYMTGGGLRADVTGGLALFRSNHTRMFIQADISLLLSETVAPSALFSIGVGR